MKIYIVGSGGVGGYFGGKLAKTENSVTFLARGKHLDQLRSKGLVVNAVDGSFKIKNPNVISRISEIKDPDFIFFSVKTYDTKEVAQELSKVVREKTIIITFQNGTENDDEIKKYISGCNIYPGLAYIISTKEKAGVINQTGGPRKIIFGDRDNKDNENLEEIASLMRKSGIDAVVSDDITRDLWKKYVFINAFSGMTAICRTPIGKVLEDDITSSLYERCVRESIEVAKKLRVNLPATIFEDAMTLSRNFEAASKSSLLVDIESGRKNEIETLNGTLVRLAQKFDIDTPINALIYGSIKLSSDVIQ
ncbi:MAG: 2-dehydropantoate 2-reductase [Patescibacteria group bacterium]|nr:2-dehydropantoate 2-reductase [Patescibacteria group bacterium]